MGIIINNFNSVSTVVVVVVDDDSLVYCLYINHKLLLSFIIIIIIIKCVKRSKIRNNKIWLWLSFLLFSSFHFLFIFLNIIRFIHPSFDHLLCFCVGEFNAFVCFFLTGTIWSSSSSSSFYSILIHWLILFHWNSF